MARTFDVDNLTEADVDLIVLALDQYISSQKQGVPGEYVDLMLRFDDLTDPVLAEATLNARERITQHENNIIRVDFDR
jgi:hypothetical protein